jgi:hypothetical protein
VGLFLRVRQELLNRLDGPADQETMPGIAGPHAAFGMTNAAAFGGMTNDEVRMTKQIRMTNDEVRR